MKRVLLTLLCSLITFTSFADEGMWLPSLISSRINDMKAKGFQLSADDIYSINKASLKDAVVLFNDGCTGELISGEGLLLTNHHCGYDAIQRLSSVDHDYLTHGFWALSRAEELPNEDLNVKFLVRMEEVTDRVSAGETKSDIIKTAVAEGVGYKATVEQMYYGNQYFLFVYEQFDDVRLVGAPPSSIGKFGGDTDNWIWPRHTGDFSMFRIYADKDNKPSKYSAENVPYRPKRHFPVSTKGVKEGDFTMIYGFPGNTQVYILSDAVNYIANIADPMKIRIRTKRLDILGRAQATDPALRIYYAADHASIANGWKKWQGEVLGIKRLNTVERKREYETAFEQWAQDKPEYRDVVAGLKAEYTRITDAYFARELIRETLNSGVSLRTIPMKYTDEERNHRLFVATSAVDAELYRELFREYYDNCPPKYMVEEFRRGVDRWGSAEAYADYLSGALAQNNGKPCKRLDADIKAMSDNIVKILGTKSLRNLNSERLNELYTTYIKGLREWDEARAFFPDANLTLRVAYGSVQGYEYADGEYHRPQTTIDGIIAKDDPMIYDYDIPQSLRDIYATKDYGRWAVDIDGRKSVPVCFLADNQTTGGNSGSPIVNGNGELVGINFDRTWLSTMSDIEFDPTICRNISVDIRYVLFVIDRVGGASYLFDEMNLK